MATRKTARPSTSTKSTKRTKDPVLRYVEDVLSGKIVAGPHVRNACRRHLADLEHGPKRGLTWDLDAALWAIGFFAEVLHLAGGQFEGETFILEPSQAFIVGSIFGWKRRDGTRRYRRVYVEKGKGNGKSPLAAGIGLYCMVADKEARAEVYAAASQKDQAMVLFRDAVAMVDQSPALNQRIVKSGGNPVWNLSDARTGSFFRPISSEDGKSGPRPSCALCDEIHEMRDGGMIIQMLERGFKWRRQPLLLMITNSGSDRNSACWEEHRNAVRVCAGTKDFDDEVTFVYDPEFVRDLANDQTFGYVCSLDKDDDPLEDPTCWIKANPLLGVTMQPEKLAEEVSKAKALPGNLNGILRLHFCVWTDAEKAWMSRKTLESVMAEFDPREHVGKGVSIGADLSGSQDLTALGFCVQTDTKRITRIDADGEKILELPTYDAWVEAWTPKDTLAERSLRDEAPYEVWVKGGWLNAVEGRIIRMDFVAARLAEVNAEYEILVLAYDRYAYRKLEQEMDAQGLTIKQVEHPQGGVRRAKPPPEAVEAAKLAGEEPPQGLWMPGSVLALETLILEERIRIRKSPVVISAMMSAAQEHDPFDNRWFSKRKAVNRIDALVALTMAVGAATAAPVTDSSVYSAERGLLVLG